MLTRTCKGKTDNGTPCRAAPVHGSEFCVFHDPSFAETLQDARKAGGQRRRREVTLAAAYDLDGLDSIGALYRVLEIITFDAIAMDNTIARGRLLLGVVAAGVKLKEVGDHEDRLQAIEAALGPRLVKRGSRR
jgi:hypothetical protein